MILNFVICICRRLAKLQLIILIVRIWHRKNEMIDFLHQIFDWNILWPWYQDISELFALWIMIALIRMNWRVEVDFWSARRILKTNRNHHSIPNARQIEASRKIFPKNNRAAHSFIIIFLSCQSQISHESPAKYHKDLKWIVGSLKRYLNLKLFLVWIFWRRCGVFFSLQKFRQTLK